MEVTVPDRGTTLPATRPDFREQLPGVEPDRQLTDWGRSERVEALVDHTVYDFLYRYWFRVEVEGVENIPADGPVLLAANHSGALPSDAAMVVKAVREEHRRPRPVHLITDQDVGRVPGVGMLFTKLGGVGAHPANIRRLLFDEEQVVLVFPEGVAGARKPLKERYRLRSFGASGFVETALEAHAPIVPVAVLGTEEAMPVLPGARTLRRLARLPMTPTIPLPAKVRVRFLEPAPASAPAEQIRALIQENLFEMVGERRSVWLG